MVSLIVTLDEDWTPEGRRRVCAGIGGFASQLEAVKKDPST
jgi:hypothetical protein